MKIQTSYSSNEKKYDLLVSLLGLDGKTEAQPFNGLLKRHCENREKMAHGQMMLGEYAVRIFSDMFGLSCKNIQQLENIWVLLYHHALIVDDIIDCDYESYKQDVLLSQIVLDRAFSLMLKNELFRDYKLIEALEAFRRETWSAMLHEYMPSYFEREHRRDTVSLQGSKLALAKICAEMLGVLNGYTSLSDKQNESIQLLFEGIQLLDDLTDYLEDYEKSKNNFLFESMSKWLKSKNVLTFKWFSTADKETLIAALVFSSAISDSWMLAGEKIDSSLKKVKAPADAYFSVYFRELAGRCRQSRMKLNSLLENNQNEIGIIVDRLVDNPNDFKRVICTGKNKKIWEQICNIIQNGPTASN